MFALNGYFDESGTHDGSETVAVAGFIAHADQWLAFEPLWKEALKEFGLDFFHMSEFAHPKKGGPYDWDEPVRQERLGRLIRIINENVTASYSVAVPKKLYDSVFNFRVKQAVGGPYRFVARVLMDIVSRDLDEVDQKITGGIGIAYVFEDGAKGKGELMEAYDELATLPGGEADRHVLSMRFEDKRRYVPLQAADILAYELYLDRTRQFDQDKRRTPPRLLEQTKGRWMHTAEPDMKAFAALMDLVLSGKVRPEEALNLWLLEPRGEEPKS